jgi:hypothetical protein
MMRMKLRVAFGFPAKGLTPCFLTILSTNKGIIEGW